MNEEESPSPVNFLPVLLRYKWYGLFVASILAVLSSAIILSLPPVYESSGKVLVETQQIPTDLVKSTVTTVASERIEVIKQRVMTREKLLEIVKKYPFFELEVNSPFKLAEQLEFVRSSIHINITGSPGARGGPENAIAFEVAFESTDPNVAQGVANDLVTLFLSENLKIRTERASETTEFLKVEADKVKAELESSEAEVAEFKQRYKDSLPEHLNIYANIRETARTRLSDLDRDIRGTQEQIDFVNSQNQLAGGNGSGQLTRIAQLKKALDDALVRYTPAHPDVLDLKRQLELIERERETNANSDEPVLAAGGFDQNLVDLKSKLASLKSERKVVEEKIADMEQRILTIPQVERALISLARENQIKEEQYNMLVTKARSAEISESLEEGRKSERFSIIEPPFLPVAPIKPNRKKLLIMGLGASGGLPIGVLLLLGLLNKNIIGRKSLSMVTNISIISELPHIYTARELRAKKRLVLFRLALIVASALFVVLLTHIFYMPLDELIPKVIFRLVA